MATLAISLLALGVPAFADNSVPNKGEIDVYLIAGQSNAVGSGSGQGTVDLSSVDNVFYYGVADDNIFTEITPVKYGMGNNSSKSGAEIGIADALKDSDRTSIVVKYAIGATGIMPATWSDRANEIGTWTPPSYIERELVETEGTKIGLLYENYIATVAEAVAKLKAEGYTPVLRGMWWMQGCDESNAWFGASNYEKLLSCLVEDSRRDLGEIFDCDASYMPFICGAISYDPNRGDAPRYVDMIREAQRNVMAVKPSVEIIDTENLERSDYWHITGAAQQWVGNQIVSNINAISNRVYVSYNDKDGVTESGAGEYSVGDSVTVSFATLGDYRINHVYMQTVGGDPVEVSLTDGSYTFTMPETSVHFTVESEDQSPDIIDEYGAIPSYYPEASYPFVTFKLGKFYRAYESWKAALDDCDYLGSPYGSTTLYLRRDYETVSSDNSQMVYSIKNKLILDLGGNTVTRGGGNLFQLMAKNSEGITDITVINGTVNAKNYSPVYIVTNGAATYGHNFKLTFNEITFTVASGYSASAIVIDTDSYGTDFDPEVEAIFNGCTFDFSGLSTSDSVIFDLAEPSGFQKTASVTVNGGRIIADSMTDISVCSLGDGDSFYFGKHGGDYTSVTVADGGAGPASAVYYSTEKDVFLEFDAGTSVAGGKVYTLKPSTAVITPYGIIPGTKSDADAYPFVMFMNGEFFEAYTAWADSSSNASEPNGVLRAAKDNVWRAGSCTILLRRDYVIETGLFYNISFANGIINVDLDGNTLTAGTNTLVVANKKTANNTTINFYDGEILLGGNARLVAFGQGANGIGYNFNVGFERVRIGYANGATATKLIETFSDAISGGKVNSTLRFTDCEIDLRTNAPSDPITIIELAGDPDCHSTAVSFEGGSVSYGEAGIVFASLGSSEVAPDSLIFKRYAGEYTELLISSAANPPAEWFDSDNGRVKFHKDADDGTTAKYLLYNLTTEYGAIPMEYADADTYPFILFSNGQFFSAERYWLHRAEDHNSDNLIDDKDVEGALVTARAESWRGIQILMRRDYTIISGNDKWMAHANGTVDIDLGGFTLTTGPTSLFYDYNNWASDRAYTYNVYSGTILIGGGELFLAYSGSGHSGRSTSSLNFSNVTLGFTATATTKHLITDAASDNAVLNTNNVSFTECVFDFSENLSLDFTLFNTSNGVGNHKMQIAVNDCRIKLDEYAPVNFASLTEGYDTLTLEDVTVELGAEAGEALFEIFYTSQSAKTYSLAPTDEANVYTLSEDIYITGYGRVPAAYADAETYPFIVFANGEFYSAERYWLHRPDGTDNTVEGALITARMEAWRGISVVMRRDYDIQTGQDKWMAHANGTVSIDLCGHILTTGNVPLFIDYCNWGNDRSYTYNIFNGKILLDRGALLEAYSWTDINTGRNSYINFSDLEIGFALGSNRSTLVYSAVYESAVLNTLNVSFTDCVFDFDTNAPSNVSFIDMSASTTNQKAIFTVNGCSFKLGDTSLTMAVLTEGYDSITFGRQDGRYLRVECDKDAPAPSGSFMSNDGELAFRRIGSTEESYIYELQIKAVSDLTFTPKASVTLDSDLIFNIYIPESTLLKGATLDGKELTLENAIDGYYLVATPLSSKEAAKTLTLKVTLEVNGTTVYGTFTFSTTKYVKQLLNMDITDAEEILAKDMLAYIRSAYVYFNKATADTAEVKDIDEVLNGYASTKTISGEYVNNSSIMYGATFVFDATPTIRFILPEGASASGYTFKIGNSTLAYTTDTVTDGGKTYVTVDISLMAYRMAESITYSCGTASGTYHIKSYYDGDEAKADANLLDLVAKFYNYCDSARNYKNTFIGR